VGRPHHGTERYLADKLRGCHPRGHRPRHLDPPRRGGCLDQGPERADREREHHRLQGEPGGHVRSGGRFL
ncbi:MAG: hypothetical protein AVDCRST_MAG03-3043, partial [uncultured Rubrobacteraceae bacterium]